MIAPIMIEFKVLDTNLDKDISLGGYYEFPLYISLGAYRKEIKRGNYHYASRAWKKLMLFLIIVNKIFDMLKSKNEVVIADLGCGSCYLLTMLESNFVEYPSKRIVYYGIDLKENILRQSYENLKNVVKKVEATLILHNLLNGVPLPQNSVDIAVCLEVIKYWENRDIETFLDEVYRILKSDGLFFLSTQGIFVDKSVDIEKYLEKAREKGMKSAFYLKDFIKLLSDKGFVVEDILATEGYKFDIDKKYEKLKDYIPVEILEAVFGILDEASHSKLFILRKR